MNPTTRDEARTSLRLDKWLWYARFCKTRSLATRLCLSGQIRIAGHHVVKAHHPARLGDVLTFPLGRTIRVVRIRAFGVRRGPPAEARTLYEDLTPPMPPPAPVGERSPGSGRPTKRERREIDRLKGED